MQREVNTLRHSDTHTYDSWPSPVHFGGRNGVASRLQSHFCALKPPSLSKLNMQFYWNITFSSFQWSIVAAVADAAVTVYAVAVKSHLCCLWNWSCNCANNVRFSLKLFRWQESATGHHDDSACGKVNTNKCREMPIHNLRFLRTQSAVYTDAVYVVCARFVADECVAFFFSSFLAIFICISSFVAGAVVDLLLVFH